MLNWLLARLKEQSTWKGLTLILSAVGIALSPEQMAAIVTAAVSVVGVIEVFRKEKK